jgi:excisionase family DNA binding protein
MQFAGQFGRFTVLNYYETKLLSQEQVATRLGVSLSTVRRLVKEGLIHAQRIGPRTLRITEGSVNAYADKGGAR